MTALSSQKKSPVYLVYYPYNENICVLELEADSFADARARLRALANGEVKGELDETVEIPKPLHWNLTLVYVWLKIRRWLFGRE